MSIAITHTWGSLTGKPTVATALRDKLGREPTHAELVADVRRILREAHEERKAK
jgi:hypothetical protein